MRKPTHTSLKPNDDDTSEEFEDFGANDRGRGEIAIAAGRDSARVAHEQDDARRLQD